MFMKRGLTIGTNSDAHVSKQRSADNLQTWQEVHTFVPGQFSNTILAVFIVSNSLMINQI